MDNISKYIAKKPDENGIIHYSNEENQVWHDLVQRQTPVVNTRASSEYLDGMKRLNLNTQKIPQCREVNKHLQKTSGWSVVPVEALIPDDYFFELLSEKKFPAASFIRCRDEINYLQEPDIFHELFGHCPMLTDPVYANFMQLYGKTALKASTEDRKLLGRLYWFTVEFGLINTKSGLRCYGGGILSSKEETIYALESNIPERRPFDGGLAALRTPYRIDQLQTIYYVIDSYHELYDLFNNHILDVVHKAQKLGDFAANFET